MCTGGKSPTVDESLFYLIEDCFFAPPYVTFSNDKGRKKNKKNNDVLLRGKKKKRRNLPVYSRNSLLFEFIIRISTFFWLREIWLNF
jgi:hypothetical protein